ncbi:MAG: hypothetical protein IJZ67_00935 [Alistipes sp.]|nr:hypothetical protein [Alistipes sp.]
MKKIFNLILAALVIIGAAACTKSDEIVDQTQQGEGLSFYAEIVNGDTRAYIDDTDGDKTWNTIWENGDQVSVRGAGKTYTFTYDGAKFTCTADGVTSIIGETVTISPTVFHFADAKAGKRGWSFNTAILTFTEGMTVEFEANTSYFRYTYNGDKPITFTVEDGYTGQAGTNFVVQDSDSYSVAYNESITFDGGNGENFIAFYFGTNKYSKGAKLSYSIDGVKCKETTIDLYVGKVYNLGTLTEPEPEPELATVYLVPGVWAADGARFAVYETATETWTNMTPVTGEFGLYSAEVSSSKIIFARMNPSTSENNWDNKWNQTADLVVPTDDKNCYYITDWGETDGEWRTYTATEWAVAGSFSNDDWKTELKMDKVTDAVYALKSLTLKAYDEFKVKSYGSWDTSFGAGKFAYSTPGYWQTVKLNGSSNIVVDTAGTYDIYFDVDNIRLYIVTAGSDYTAATEQTVNGTEPEQDADAPMLYLKPNANWKLGSARFAAYFFGNGERWVSMTDSDSDGIYEVAIPTDKNFPNIIFCRMNPDKAANNWDNKWDQTNDLVIPTDGKNLYTITEGAWSNGGGSWSTK